jgi:radical SAM protein with 4Fe4S-binding SPASM domain
MKYLRLFRAALSNLSHNQHVSQWPIHLQIEVSTFCNLACVMCPHPTLITNPQHMPLRKFQEVFDNIKPLKVSMSGLGEPFLNPDMAEIVRYAHVGGAETITTSNLTVVTPDLAQKIVESGLGLLKGSIDSTDPSVYAAIRKRDLHHKVLEGLKNLREAKQLKRSKTPLIRLQFVMQKANYRDIPEVLDLAEEQGVEAIYFQPIDLAVDEYVDAKLVDELIGGMDKDEFRAVLELAAEKASHMQISTNLPDLTRDFKKIWEKYRLVESPDSPSAVCLMPWTSTYITVEGDILPCCSFAASDGMIMGNAFNDDFMEVWNGERYKALRKVFREKKRPHKICCNCIAPTLWRLVKASSKSSKFMLFR